MEKAPEACDVNPKTGRERWHVIVWDDPEVIAEIKRRLDERREDAGPVVRDFLRERVGLPKFPAGLPDGEGK
jgi:hypothetical protein